ncbi:MAG: hypothetical protein GSR72_02200 [Desulfurococcales archaeon]|nr:hypothetical protein [Desulfurococcales archaeon]
MSTRSWRASRALAAYVLGELALVAEPENLSSLTAVEVELSVYDVVPDAVPVKGLYNALGDGDRLGHYQAPLSLSVPATNIGDGL